MEGNARSNEGRSSVEVVKQDGQATTWRKLLFLGERFTLDHRFSYPMIVLPDIKGRTFYSLRWSEFTQGKTTILLCIPKCRRYLRCLEDVVYSRGTDFIFVVVQYDQKCTERPVRRKSTCFRCHVSYRLIYMYRENRDTRVLWNYFFKIITHNSGSLRMSYISAASRVGRSNTTWANFCTEFERFSSSSFPFLTSTAMEGIHGKWRDTQKNWWSIKQSSKQRRWDKGSDS